MPESFEYNGFPVRASFGSTREANPRLRAVKFGDGYEQIAPDGINHNPLRFSVAFAKRSRREAQYILDFLEARGGYEEFYWVPPAPYDSRRLFRAKTWKHIPHEFNDEEITADFEQVFTPDYLPDYLLDDDGLALEDPDDAFLTP